MSTVVTPLDSLEIPGALKVVFGEDETTSWYAWSGTRWEFVPVGGTDEQQMRDAAAWLLAAKWPMDWQQRPDAPGTFRLCVNCERGLCYFHYTGLRYVAGYSNPPRPCWLCPDCGARTYGDPVQERAA